MEIHRSSPIEDPQRLTPTGARVLRGGYVVAATVVVLGAIVSPVMARQVRDQDVGQHISPHVLAVGVLAVGLVSSVALAVLLVLLSRSREQAMRLCDRKTGQLRHQALHDALTGLPNRALVQDRAEQMLARSQRSATRCAALFIGLDRFKDINDTIGRAAGDELLKAAGARLTGILRDADTIGRLGGDEFVVLLEGSDEAMMPEAVAERVLAALRQPFRLPATGDAAVRITASVGIADHHDDSASDLLLDADVALYRAKAAGRDRWVRFVPEMQAEAFDRASLGMDLRRAIGAGELFVMYQPTVELAKMRLVGMEALVRWNHPSRGLVQPDDFIPLAEETGTIVELGRWVLRRACREAAHWSAAGYRLQVAVNVSAKQLDDDLLISDVRAALHDSGLDADLLALEITETALVTDTDATIARLRKLKALGAQIAIDDFGTGYSSLAYLSRFPIDIVKIDRSFVSGMTGSAASGALVHTLVQLGKTLGLETIAEGIEELEQMQFLRDEGCDVGQGYLFARPLPTDELPDFLARWTGIVGRVV